MYHKLFHFMYSNWAPSLTTHWYAHLLTSVNFCTLNYYYALLSKKSQGINNGLPPEKAKKQGEMPLPILSPIPCIKCRIYRGMRREGGWVMYPRGYPLLVKPYDIIEPQFTVTISRTHRKRAVATRPSSKEPWVQPSLYNCRTSLATISICSTSMHNWPSKKWQASPKNIEKVWRGDWIVCGSAPSSGVWVWNLKSLRGGGGGGGGGGGANNFWGKKPCAVGYGHT